MSSQTIFVALVLAVGVERVAELVVSERNRRWSMARGGVESGGGHYPLMVALHTGLLLGAVGEVVVWDRPFLPWLGWPALGLLLGSQGLRWWCVATLGRQWCTRVVVVPGLTTVMSGPYRWLRHPNYLAVAVEGAALPLVHTAWVTAVTFTVLNALLLRTRIRTENLALRALAGPA